MIPTIWFHMFLFIIILVSLSSIISPYGLIDSILGKTCN